MGVKGDIIIFSPGALFWLSLANLKTKNKSGLIQTFQTWKQPKPTQFWFGANFSIISTFDKNLENAIFFEKMQSGQKMNIYFSAKISIYVW